mmetsp:Transcript_74722/g.216866  ORF Transcript_74722/g.216866 Transcript_74722/m.216866 type:complete len:287 (-) Transcript_74722:7-867(-)
MLAAGVELQAANFFTADLLGLHHGVLTVEEHHERASRGVVVQQRVRVRARGGGVEAVAAGGLDAEAPALGRQRRWQLHRLHGQQVWNAVGSDILALRNRRMPLNEKFLPGALVVPARLHDPGRVRRIGVHALAGVRGEKHDAVRRHRSARLGALHLEIEPLPRPGVIPLRMHLLPLRGEALPRPSLEEDRVSRAHGSRTLRPFQGQSLPQALVAPLGMHTAIRLRRHAVPAARHGEVHHVAMLQIRSDGSRADQNRERDRQQRAAAHGACGAASQARWNACASRTA